MRNMVFISHANPEDNVFTQWLALRLASEGYPVWCDLTKLLGGENFWEDIEEAIRERTQKFIYVLSRISNRKPGPRKELQVAENVMRDNKLRDFIIPLSIDDLPHREINIQLSPINVIPFNEGWASGLKLLIEKLHKDKVTKNLNFTPSTVTSWWGKHVSADNGIKEQPEEYLSNWFPIQALPNNILFHALKITELSNQDLLNTLPYPFFIHGHYLVSFTQAYDFANYLGRPLSKDNSHIFSTNDFLDGKMGKGFVKDKIEAKGFVLRLLRISWERMIKERGLPTYELANSAHCLYFPKGLVKDDKIYFKGLNGENTFRSVVGYKSIKRNGGKLESKRFWHFSIDAKPLLYPITGYIIKPHVFFSDDGNKIWESKERLHTARRSQCRNWWNQEWRDRILATMFWLADEEGKIRIRLGRDIFMDALNYPLTFNSPFSYDDPDKKVLLIADEEEEDDYEFDELEEKDEE